MLRLLRLTPIIILSACTLFASEFAMPMENADDRPTPLHFGLYVTPDPEQNPIDPPERFTGFHAALDFEVEKDELEQETPVFAICDGNVLRSEWAEGYGGVLVQSCVHEGEDITVLYGHLDPKSLMAKDTPAKKGERIGILAPARTYESDGNRKHLHLGIHKGKDVSMLGYVQEEQELTEFLDPAEVLGL
jgi:murein DD-endopeptidase MepM/ murein hydrolase activator NlpD